MSDIEELTDGLMETFRGLRSGTVEAKDAQELANVAGKVISAYKTRIAYAILRGDAPEIAGLEASQPMRRIGRGVDGAASLSDLNGTANA